MDANATALTSTDGMLRRVGKNIEEQRERFGLTQQGLADRAAVDRLFLSKVERGSRISSVIVLAKLAQAMDVTMSTLVHGV